MSVERTINRGEELVVSYDRTEWSRAAAWAHLSANWPEEIRRIPVSWNEAYNPWRREHDEKQWAWRFDPDAEVVQRKQSEKLRGCRDPFDGSIHAYPVDTQSPGAMLIGYKGSESRAAVTAGTRGRKG